MSTTLSSQRADRHGITRRVTLNLSGRTVLVRVERRTTSGWEAAIGSGEFPTRVDSRAPRCDLRRFARRLAGLATRQSDPYVWRALTANSTTGGIAASSSHLPAKPGRRVFWRDPDGGTGSAYGTIVDVDGDEILSLVTDGGSEVEALEHELRMVA